MNTSPSTVRSPRREQPGVADGYPIPGVRFGPVSQQSLTALESDLRASRNLLLTLLDRLTEQLDALSRRRAEMVQNGSAALEAADVLSVDEVVRIYCLGKFRIIWQGCSTNLHASVKSAMIAKILAMAHRKPVQREVLMEILWPGIAPAIANNRLKVAMYSLRSLFDGSVCGSGRRPFIIYSEGCYAYNPEVPLWVDVEAFESCWQTGLALTQLGRLDDAAVCLSQAEQLYQGDFLEEDRYEEWTLLRREELRGIYLAILDKLSCHWYQHGQTDQAAEGWRKILAIDPWREDVYRHLMVSLARSGNRGQALRWYQTCRRILLRELGIEPEPETTSLYEHILKCTNPREIPDPELWAA